MKILLTGGAGYVGSACLRWLLAHGHDPIAFDDLSEGNARAVPEDRLLSGDILGPDALVRAMDKTGAEAVMHFAAAVSVPESIDYPDRYWRANLLGTQNVLEAMRKVGLSKLVFSSTAAVYSFDAPMPLKEDSELKPAVPYGRSKLAAEWLIQDYRQAFGIGGAILRYFNASGADADGHFGECRGNESHLIPLVLEAALGKREKLSIYGDDWDTRDGTCVRDYVHTDDLARAHQLAVEALQENETRIYNVGSGTGATVLEVCRACEEVVGRPIRREIAPRRAGDCATLIAGSGRLKRDLGWSPDRSDIRTIVETAWRWHEQHPAGYSED